MVDRFHEILNLREEFPDISHEKKLYDIDQKAIWELQRGFQKIIVSGFSIRSTIPQGKTIYMQNLRSNVYKLRRDIPVYLQEEDAFYTAISYDINQYGTGPSEEDAIQDLCEVIVEYYELLKEEADKLGKDLQGHLIYLRDIIEKV